MVKTKFLFTIDNCEYYYNGSKYFYKEKKKTRTSKLLPIKSIDIIKALVPTLKH